MKILIGIRYLLNPFFATTIHRKGACGIPNLTFSALKIL